MSCFPMQKKAVVLLTSVAKIFFLAVFALTAVSHHFDTVRDHRALRENQLRALPVFIEIAAVARATKEACGDASASDTACADCRRTPPDDFSIAMTSGAHFLGRSSLGKTPIRSPPFDCRR